MQYPRLFLFSIAGIIFCLISACEFEPSLRYEPERDQDRPPPVIWINELSFNEEGFAGDTLIMYRDKLFSFNFSAGEEEILAIKVLLDHNEMILLHDSAGSVGLSHERMSAGFHTLSVEIYTNSGTGSIADQLLEEVYQFKKDITLHVVKYYAGVSASTSDGFLKLDWKDYLGDDLLDYRVVIDLKGVFSCYQSEYIHRGHIGTPESFTVWSRISEEVGYNWGNVDLPDEIPQIRLLKEDSASFYVYSEKPKYYGAIDRIEIYEALDFAPRRHVRTITNMDSCSYRVENVQHGEYRWYYFIYYGKYPRHPLNETPASYERNARFWFGTNP